MLVIGLDGGTYDVLAPLAEQGVMPHVARLLRDGALATLQSTEPTITPTAWATFQTGAEPVDHGILDYRRLDHRRRHVELNDTSHLACPTLWEALAAAGQTSISLNLPLTYPPRVGGALLVGGLDAPSIDAALTPYPAFAQRMRDSGSVYDLAAIWKHRPRDEAELHAAVAQTEAQFASRVVAARVAADLYRDWRLMVVQFQALDALQHRCWHLLGIDDGPRGPAHWCAVVRRALTALDTCVGQLLDLADRRGADVLVVSDHGFGPFREKISLPELLARRGLSRLATRGQSIGYRAARSGWKLRRWLARAQRPAQGTASLVRPLSMLAPIDWRRSAAVALHGNLAGLVYINTPARFGQGAIRTAGQYEQALADVAAAFREARHPATDEPLFLDAYAVTERYGLDPMDRDWPDVVAIPAAGFHTRPKFDRGGCLMRPDPDLTGTHRRAGVLIAAGRGVATGVPHSASLADVAPTILARLGVSVPTSMTGRVLEELWSGTRPVAARAAGARGAEGDGGATHSHITARRCSAASPLSRTEANLSEDHDTREVLARLAALGYIE